MLKKITDFRGTAPPAVSAKTNKQGEKTMENAAKNEPENIPAKTNLDLIKDLYDKRKGEIAKILNDMLAPDKLFMVAMTHIRRNPILAQCDRDSFVNAIVESVQLGLDLNPVYGYAYLVPKRKNGKLYVEFQPGYRGLIELANRSGKVADIFAQIVYSNEHCDIKYGLDPDIDHKPKSPSERGDIVGAYAVARLTNGVKRFEYLWKEEIEKIKKKSESLKSDKREYSPWTTSEEEMIKKTAVRRLGKWVPLSPQMMKASVEDECREAGIDMGDVIPAYAEPAGQESAGSKVTPIRPQNGLPESATVTDDSCSKDGDLKKDAAAGQNEPTEVNPELAKKNFETVKSMLEESKTLDELKENWTYFYKELKSKFSEREIADMEAIKNKVKDKLFDAPPDTESEKCGQAPAGLFSDNGKEADDSGRKDEIEEIIAKFNAAGTEKEITGIWKDSMHVITKLKEDDLDRIMREKKKNIARVKKNA